MLDAAPALPTEGAELDPLAVANRLRPVLIHISRHLRREADSLGVTGGQVSLLAAIHARPGIGVGELAALEGMSSPTMCAHIDRLEASGLVARSRGEGPDRRRVGLTITAEGERQLDEVRSRRTAWLASGLRSLSAAELGRVAEAIEPLRLLADEPRAGARRARPRGAVPAAPAAAAPGAAELG
jgi:DNA-binding MarR family transcriptional regulator